MRILILTILLIGIFQNGYSQFAFNNVSFKLKNPPPHPFKIVQVRDGEITKIEEYSDSSTVVFQYVQGDIPPFFNWKEPHRFIYAYEFDESGRTIKRYDFNSNAGLNIYEYDYNLERNTKTTFERSFPETEVDKNTNTYANISRIKTFKDLKESSEVSTIMDAEKFILKVEYLNDAEKPIQIKEYSNMYRDSINTFIDYDQSFRELSTRVVSSANEILREGRSEYPNNNTKITTINNYRNHLKVSTYRFAEVKNDVEGTETKYSEINGELTVRHYQYEDGNLTTITVYDTKFKDQLIVPISKKSKKVAEMKYSYNSEGLLEKEEMENYKTGQKETRIYKYQIENL